MCSLGIRVVWHGTVEVDSTSDTCNISYPDEIGDLAQMIILSHRTYGTTGNIHKSARCEQWLSFHGNPIGGVPWVEAPRRVC